MTNSSSRLTRTVATSSVTGATANMIVEVNTCGASSRKSSRRPAIRSGPRLSALAMRTRTLLASRKVTAAPRNASRSRSLAANGTWPPSRWYVAAAAASVSAYWAALNTTARGGRPWVRSPTTEATAYATTAAPRPQPSRSATAKVVEIVNEYALSWRGTVIEASSLAISSPTSSQYAVGAVAAARRPPRTASRTTSERPAAEVAAT